MYTRFYILPQEKQALIREAKQNGYRLIHDDFNVGPEGENQLTFEFQVVTPKTDLETAIELIRTDLETNPNAVLNAIELTACIKHLFNIK